jgi:hypothetical protein
MKRHWKLWTSLGLLLALLGASFLISFTRQPGPVRAYERITLGMTQQEVEMQPGNYSSTPVISSMIPIGDCIRKMGASERVEQDFQAGRVRSWTWDEYQIWVTFDEDGKATGYHLLQDITEYRRSSDFFEWLRELLGV